MKLLLSHRNYNLGITYLKHRNETAEFGSMIQDITSVNTPGDPPSIPSGVKAPIKVPTEPTTTATELTTNVTPSKTMQALRTLPQYHQANIKLNE